jgi:ribose 5-phosphate isomerase A
MSVPPELQRLKHAAAVRAVELVEDGMVLGLGTGTTAGLFIQELGRRIAEGRLRVSGVPTSLATAERAMAAGIQVIERLEGPVDLAVDGADEIDPGLNLVKGHGGALFREKMVAQAARRFVVVADRSKLVPRLGRGLIPVEVLPFLWRQTAARLAGLGARWQLREIHEHPYRTDNGNLILDLGFPSGIEDPGRLARSLKQVTGVLEHGLFIGLATGCIVGGEDGVQVFGSLED